MKFQGKYFKASLAGDAIAEILFDVEGESANTLSRGAMEELDQLVGLLEKTTGLRGAYLASAKEAFCMGANVNEFLPLFKSGPQAITASVMAVHGIFNRLEDLPFPTVACLNGYALGGGMELAMSCTFRVAAQKTTIGQPEVKLGLIPGWGGCVRMPRLIGADHAIELIASGRNMEAEEALKKGLVSAVVAADKLRAAAKAMIESQLAGERWKAAVERKKTPLLLNGIEQLMVFVTAKMFVAEQAGHHYPAPVKGVEVMEQTAQVGREAAQQKEAEAFAVLSQTPVCANLVRIFLGDQFLKRKTRELAAKAQPVELAAVLGAGIMGGGVAYQSASKGVPILMKDINQQALDHGYQEITRLLTGQVERGKLTTQQMAGVLNRIQATLTYGDFKATSLVVEAVVENPEIKKKVLAETEAAVSPNTVLATNTSTISIGLLAGALKDPSRFLGMHFFNPVYRMPLVEVIRGPQSSPQAVATVVDYALKMGKNPVVVNDGPGFLVNRILFPYLYAFQVLVSEGVDIQLIDKTMERFGWPMGPGLLSDVVGLDTAHHAGTVMSQAFPGLFPANGPMPGEVLFKAGYLGQKNGKGFFSYAPDKKGKPQKQWDAGVLKVLAPAIRGGSEQMAPEEIVDRMMIPMVIEGARCLEAGIVESPTELDMALIYGIGFPPFRGGLLHYADSEGMNHLLEKAAKYQKLGLPYQPTAAMQKMAAEGKGYYPAL